MPIQVKPIPGVANQGGTIVFGDGRTVLHIEEVQESQSSAESNECGGVISSTMVPSIVTKDVSKCASMYATHEKANANIKFGDGGCDSCSNMARSN